MTGARQPGADRRETAEGRRLRRVLGRSYASPASSALSPWGSHFYPALSVSSAAKWAQEESRLWEDRQTSIEKQAGGPLRSVCQPHAELISALQPLPTPTATSELILPCRLGDSHGSLRGSPEYLVPFYRQGYEGPET